jgi:aromatic amino acid aminotransferase I
LKVDWRKHPAARAGKDHAIVEQAIFHAAIEEGVLVSCGSWFLADKTAVESDMFFRVTFAAAPENKITEAIRRLGATLKNQFGLE